MLSLSYRSKKVNIFNSLNIDRLKLCFDWIFKSLECECCQKYPFCQMKVDSDMWQSILTRQYLTEITFKFYRVFIL